MGKTKILHFVTPNTTWCGSMYTVESTCNENDSNEFPTIAKSFFNITPLKNSQIYQISSVAPTILLQADSTVFYYATSVLDNCT